MTLTRRTVLTGLLLSPALAVGLSANDEALLSLEVVLFAQAGAKPSSPKVPPLELPDFSQSLARVERKTQGLALLGAAHALARQGYETLGHHLWWLRTPANARIGVKHEDNKTQLACQLQRGQTLTLDFKAWLRQDSVSGVSINEQRRVKFTETHYFDHPQWGALVQVRNHQGDES